jgi:hypothetical protein
MEISTVNIIQTMLAPGIMISACGLLLLGMNNKYSLVVSRIRTLDEEKRKIKTTKRNEDVIPEEYMRLNNIIIQIDKLCYRVKLVKNAVICYTIAVAFFILTCLDIGVQLLSGINTFSSAIALFLVGMLSVLIGAIFAAREVARGYEIVQIEIKD